MKRELKYPVKFAVLELNKEINSSMGYEKFTRCYIASKCYVVKTIFEYLDNGDVKQSHKVVFPYTDFTYFSETGLLGNANVPLYDLEGEPYPIVTLNNIYDNYEDAHNEAMQLNEIKKYDGNSNMPYYNDYAEKLTTIENEYNKNIENIKKFENEILRQTTNMKIDFTELKNNVDLKLVRKK